MAASVGLMMLLGGCRAGEETDVLARAGSDVITAEEFRLNYEFGHAHLRRGEDAMRNYLKYMIYEKVMAQEAERLGLDTAAAVVHAMRTLREELLIERVFEDKVLSGIEVTDDEIREAVDRTAVSFRFRFIPALSEQKARAVHREVLARGFDDVLEEELTSFRDLEVPIGDVTSDYVRADDVDPYVLEVIQDLAIGSPSEPVAYGPLWYVFEVMDVRREPLAPSDYEQRASTVRTRIYNQKAMEAGARFVSSTMEPRNVVTKRQGFEVLAEALWDWYRHETPTRNLLHYIEEQGWDEPFTRRLRAAYDDLLVTFDDERWTIRTFLERFTPGRYLIRPDDRDAFRARLADIVALVVRDRVFLEMADRESLHEDEDFRRTLALWKDHRMFQQLRKHLIAEKRAGSGRWVERYADSLAAKSYRVSVNEGILDTLTTTVNDKNRHMTVHLFKNNSNKQPFPIVDPSWAPL